MHLWKKIESGDEIILQTWNEYLDHLAVLISNLRMAYDMDIILGGDVGGVLSDYMIPLGEKVMAYNGFEHDVSYLKNCSYKKEASAVGAAKYFFTKHMGEINFLILISYYSSKKRKENSNYGFFPFFLRVNCEKIHKK